MGQSRVGSLMLKAPGPQGVKSYSGCRLGFPHAYILGKVLLFLTLCQPQKNQLPSYCQRNY